MNLKIFTNNIEQEAISQIYQLAYLPVFSNSKIRIMPDVHAGAGCVIGFTADLGEKVIPNIVGVDIGCGMRVINLGNIEIDFDKLDKTIRQKVPSGFDVHDYEQKVDLSKLCCKDDLINVSHIKRSLGTLGGGNHFIEIDIDKDNNKYLVIHTGSRNLGKQIANIYQHKAIEYIENTRNVNEIVTKKIEELRKAGRYNEIDAEINKIKKEINSKTPSIPKDLCYLEGDERLNYLHDMKICQEFAVQNRKTIGETICKALGITPKETFETIHNYISFEDNIVRKGAISAKKGEKVIIPMNMRDGCLIAIGKGNDDWNNSAPHGAGRIMSRAEARSNLDINEYAKTMEGIYTTSIGKSTIDEAPQAYKSTEEIINNIKDTVDIIDIIKPIYNFKASK